MLAAVLLRRVLPVATALAVAAGALVAAAGTVAAPSGPERLPDLVQELPTNLQITRVGPASKPVYRLGFRSAVNNAGDGPLIIIGSRPTTGVATMTATQVIERDGAPGELVGNAGSLRYVVSPDHRHWHLLGFDRYELRRAGGKATLLADRKTGFCLGDRYVGARRPKASAPQPVYTGRCGLGEPTLLGVQEGISVGYGDDYAANLEGQYLRLNSLRAGRYVLVHQANADRRLRELRYGNNAASLLLDLRWRGGGPEIRVLRQCPGTDRCERPRHARATGPA